MDRRTMAAAVACIVVAGCMSGGFNSVQKTTQLAPGMSYDEVVKVMGQPEGSKFDGDKWVLRYALHESGKGNVPYDLVLDRQSRTLQQWQMNEEDYQKGQHELASLAAAIGMGPCTAGTKGGQAAPASGGGAATPADPALGRTFAGMWYSYTSAMGGGGTERKLYLYPDGTYSHGQESAYSGRTSDGAPWQQAGGSGGRGRWSIHGTRQSGTITLTETDGTQQAVPYRQGEAADAYYFNGVKYAGPSPIE